MAAMDLEKVSKIMDKFESQFEDLDVKTGVSRLDFMRHSYTGECDV